MNKLLQDVFFKPTYLSPAQSRHYGTSDACLKDWNAGKDFKLSNGTYTSIKEYPELSIDGPVYIIISNRQNVKVTGL